MKLLLATANQHKVREIAALLAGVPDLELASLREYPAVLLPEETGSTMAENARLKAAWCLRQTGLPSLADDSGLEVDALQGRPGVHSARWVAGTDEDRLQALLNLLQQVPDSERTAQYRCALCLALPDPDGQVAYRETEAVCRGRIGREPLGGNGFGYDPVFEITAETGAGDEWIGHTIAEAPPAVKAGVSHRARAVVSMTPVLRHIAGCSRGTVQGNRHHASS